MNTLKNYSYFLSLTLAIILFPQISHSFFDNRDDYKKEIELKGIEYSRQSFLREVKQDNKEIIDLFIKAGIDVNYKDSDGATALMYTASKGDIGLSKMLIAKDANVNARTNDGITPIILALFEGKSLELANLLIEEGADVHAAVNYKDKDGTTALMLVSAKNDIDLARLLLDKGADINARTNNGSTALLAALFAAEINRELVNFLIEKGADVHAAVNFKDKYQYTALHFAVLADKIGSVQFLIENGADINSLNILGKTALTTALTEGYIEVAKFLIEKGADVNTRGKTEGGLYAHTALMEAVSKGHYEVAELLIEKGADINAKSHDGSTSLMYAVEKNNSNIVKLLLNNKADVTVKSNNGMTALKYAKQLRNEALIQLLLSAGAIE